MPKHVLKLSEKRLRVVNALITKNLAMLKKYTPIEIHEIMMVFSHHLGAVQDLNNKQVAKFIEEIEAVERAIAENEKNKPVKAVDDV